MEIIIVLCYLPLLGMVFGALAVALFLGLRGRWVTAILVSLILAPFATLAVVIGSQKASGKPLEFGCLRGGVCCGGVPFNALIVPSCPASVAMTDGSFGVLQGSMA